MALGQAANLGTRDSRLQGRYGEAFVGSIAVAAGFHVQLYAAAEGIDLSVYRSLDNRSATPDASRTIYLQVKSWSDGGLSPDGMFHYKLKVRTYNYLVGPHGQPHFLALCLLPSEPDSYMEADHDRLLCRQAAYWLSLEGRAPIKGVSDDSKRVVQVPAANLLTPSTMKALVAGNLNQAVAR